MSDVLIASNLNPPVSSSQQSLKWTWFMACLWIDAMAVTSMVALALWSGDRADAPFAEGAAMTVFSAGQLMLLAGLAFELLMVRARMAKHNRQQLFIWPLIGLGMLVLACDEAFELHERFDLMLHEWFSLRESPWTDRIDDVIVLLYGLIGLASLWLYRAELRLFRAAWPYLAIAFVLFFVMVALDLVTNSYSIAPDQIADPAVIANLAAWGNVAEESCKIASEAAFIGAFIAMIGMARAHAEQSDRAK